MVAAEAFARALGEAFCECRPEFVHVPRLLMTSSPYTYVPTAATALARGHALAVLDDLGAAGVRLAIVSNAARHSEHLLDRFGFRDRMSSVRKIRHDSATPVANYPLSGLVETPITNARSERLPVPLPTVNTCALRRHRQRRL